MRLRFALPQKLEAALRKAHNLAFVLVLKFVTGLDLAIRNVSDVLDNVLSLADKSNQGLILGFEQLQQRPYRNMLERGVTRLQESAEISMNAAVWLCPVLNKDRVVANCTC